MVLLLLLFFYFVMYTKQWSAINWLLVLRVQSWDVTHIGGSTAILICSMNRVQLVLFISSYSFFFVCCTTRSSERKMDSLFFFFYVLPNHYTLRYLLLDLFVCIQCRFVGNQNWNAWILFGQQFVFIFIISRKWRFFLLLKHYRKWLGCDNINFVFFFVSFYNFRSY